jgi:hypothetical protein
MKIKLILAILLMAAAVSARRMPYGAVDCDVNPDDAIVYANGRALGPADDFDGWPDYLHLKAGPYELEFRLEGYETYRVQFLVNPGGLTRIRHTLNRVDDALNEAEEEMEENPENTEQNPGGTWGSVSLKLFPENAVCYVDERLFATAEDLARLHAPLQIEAGKHIMVCYAPGYEEVTREFTIEPGEYLELDVVLDKK